MFGLLLQLWRGRLAAGQLDAAPAAAAPAAVSWGHLLPCCCCCWAAPVCDGRSAEWLLSAHGTTPACACACACARACARMSRYCCHADLASGVTNHCTAKPAAAKAGLAQYGAVSQAADVSTAPSKVVRVGFYCSRYLLCTGEETAQAAAHSPAQHSSQWRQRPKPSGKPQPNRLAWVLFGCHVYNPANLPLLTSGACSAVGAAGRPWAKAHLRPASPARNLHSRERAASAEAAPAAVSKLGGQPNCTQQATIWHTPLLGSWPCCALRM